MVFAKKGDHINVGQDVYTAEVYSFTHQRLNHVRISRKYLEKGMRVLIIDDFLANGAAIKGLMSIIEQAGCTLVGAGVCFCAVCDGAFYKDKTVAVTGGGNSALQDAMLLSEKCSRVYLIHRRDSFRGEAKLVEALREKENVEFILNARREKLLGEEELSALLVRQEEKEYELEVDGLFVAIGHAPDNKAFAGLIELDEAGYALAGEDCMGAVPGVFVAGDCRRKKVRQVTTAVADGSVAALAACEWLG